MKVATMGSEKWQAATSGGGWQWSVAGNWWRVALGDNKGILVFSL